ncbi:MAG: LysM peptidoglycan-binding domain-containing protein [Paludibacter sp.]|nr:LysM peptidoglycan-binding domain-containing protein [Paludibacter sp.]
MKSQLRSIILFSTLLFSLLTFSQIQNQSYLLYIDQYHQIAVRQQKEHGIPASIVLAQGLLESGAGKSELSKASNNHFGIKCTDWAGEKVYHDDDEKGECFRKYNQVLDSYEDHALFLRNRTRYASLFQLKPTDYEGWAFGLKRAGYATDPSYAFKLISIIENYNLQKFDTQTYLADNSTTGNNSSSKSANGDYYGSMGSINASQNHEVLKANGVRFVKSLPGDTYKSIADEFNTSEKRILTYNEINLSTRLSPGTRVYISYKKRKALKGFDNYIIKAGDSMYSIAQVFGIKTASLYKLNLMDYSQAAKVGQVLKLR